MLPGVMSEMNIYYKYPIVQEEIFVTLQDIFAVSMRAVKHSLGVSSSSLRRKINKEEMQSFTESESITI